MGRGSGGRVSRAVTTVPQGSRMPPTPPSRGPDDPTRSRRRVRPLEQIPVWHGFEPAAGADPSIDGAPDTTPSGVQALLEGLTRAAARGDAWRGPLLVVAAPEPVRRSLHPGGLPG
jgi:hypothetical protein